LKVVGLDIGGSRSRFVLWDGRKILKRGHLKWKYGDSWIKLRELVEDLRIKLNADSVSYAIRGVWGEKEKRKMERILKGKVISDVEGVLYDAFGEKDGMVLIAGTGSICVARKNGEIYRFGGYGYLFSDWGSAFWIGRMAVELLLKRESFLRIAIFNSEDLEDVRNEIKRILTLKDEYKVRKIARFSRVVIRCAELGDQDSIYIVLSAIRELINMCIKVREQSGIKDLAVHGGLFKNDYFKENFSKYAKRYGFNIVGYGFDGARGAAKFTMASGGLR